MLMDDQILNAKILIIDDQEISIRLLTEILVKAGFTNITSSLDSREASNLYKKIRPDLLILDLNMPYLDGFQIMTQLKQIDGDTYLPILVLSNDDNPERRYLALESGAKDFLNKPFDRVEVLMRIHNLLEVRILHMEVLDQNKILEDKVRQRTQELYESQLDVIQRLARAVEFRDMETGMHIIRMSHYSVALSEKVGLDPPQCELILAASPLHDIGKIGIPDAVLQKKDKLSPKEWEIMKKHTVIGADLLSGSKSRFLNVAQEIALTHHERWDGSGYPQGLKGESIPLVGRICGLCDVFDALLTKRPYKKAWPLQNTLKYIKESKGTHFDPKLVDDFFDLLPQINQIRRKYSDKEP